MLRTQVVGTCRRVCTDYYDCSDCRSMTWPASPSVTLMMRSSANCACVLRIETDRWRMKREIFCERRWLKSRPKPKTWLTPFVNSLSHSEASNWNCRRAGPCRSRRISNDCLGHECAVGTVAADTVGRGVGLDAITARDRAFHNNHNGGGASVWHCLVAARKTTRFAGVRRGADIRGASGRKSIALR